MRQVQRRLDAVDRALSGRIAVGDQDEDDEREHEALGRFRASLPPPPSRWLTLGGVVAIIVLAQALLAWFWTHWLSAISEDRQRDDIRRAFEDLDAGPDVKSIGDLTRALAAGSYEELAIVLVTLALIAYLCMRPFASGYWLSRVLLGRPEKLRRRQRGSPLTELAVRIDIAGLEEHVARAARADLKRDAPVDLLAKALPCFVGVFFALGYARYVSATQDDADWEVFAVVGALSGLRLAWLILRMRQRRQAVWWIVVPVAFIALLAVVAPMTQTATTSRWTDRDELVLAREVQRVDRLPQLDRAELRLTLGASTRLDGVDLRGVDLPRTHLRGKTLRFADLRLADLRRADLSDADLRNAVLVGSLLRGADLRRADLRSADLRCANLRAADLRGAKLAAARLDGALVDVATRWPAHPGGRSSGEVNVAPEDEWFATYCADR